MKKIVCKFAISDEVKRALVRFERVFVSSFIVAFTGELAIVDKGFLAGMFKKGFVGSLEAVWALFVFPAVLSGLTALINALAKYLRDKYPEKNLVVNRIL